MGIENVFAEFSRLIYEPAVSVPEPSGTVVRFKTRYGVSDVLDTVNRGEFVVMDLAGCGALAGDILAEVRRAIAGTDATIKRVSAHLHILAPGGTPGA